MSHTYSSNFVHCIFSTKNRAAIIPTESQEVLWAYLIGICKNTHVGVIAVGGTENHIHILIVLPAHKRLSDVVRDIKANSSRWMNETTRRFSWQEGYGAFSVSPSQLTVVKEYIRNQTEHHKKRNFEEEFIALLKKSGIEYDPEYVLG